MRLFIAINPDETIRRKIADVQQQLRPFAVKGNFTRLENIHLTLVFIGDSEPEHIALIRDAMDSIEAAPFSLMLSGAGSFSGRGGPGRRPGDIWWLGLQPSAPLLQLQKDLTIALHQAGFLFEKRVYTPHLTIARSVHTSVQPQLEYAPVEIPVQQISLMHSHQAEGRLTYSVLYDKQL